MPQNSSSKEFGRRYFSHSPLRSYHFWVSTFFFLLVACIGFYYTMRFRTELSAEATLSMIFPVVVAAFLWFRVWKAHHEVSHVYKSTEGIDTEAHEDPRVDLLINNLGYMLYGGFALALFALGSAYVAIGQSVAATSGR